jgi:exosortase H (IPTLxxWG-CTERM-specific)
MSDMNRQAKSEEQQSDNRRKHLLRFILIFSILVVIGAIAYPHVSIAFTGVIRKFMSFTAGICAVFLEPFYEPVSLSGRIVTIHGFAVEVIEECTGIYEMLLFAAAVLAFPSTWKSKGLGFLMGLPLIYFFNILRIVFLAVIGVHFRSLFDFMHIYFWQATLVVIIVTVWFLWIRLVATRAKQTSPIFS